MSIVKLKYNNLVSHKKHILMIVSFLVAFLWSMLFAGRGIDITDFALQLYLQENAFNLVGDTWSSVPLTNYIGGLWMSFAPIENMMYWAFVGGAILYGIMAFFATGIYLEIFKKIGAFDILIIFGVILIYKTRCMIDYYMFPTALSIVFFYLLAKSISKLNVINLVCLGLIGGLVLFSRFTFISLLFIPILIYGYEYFQSKNFDILFKRLKFYFVGLFFSILLLFIFFLLWKSCYEAGNSELNLSNIIIRLKVLLRTLLTIVKMTIMAVVLSFFIMLFNRYIKNKKLLHYAGMFLLVSTFIVCCFIYYGIYISNENLYLYNGLPVYKYFHYFYIIPLSLFVIIILLLLSKSISGINSESISRYKLYIILLCLFSLMIPFGSDVARIKLGFMSICYMMILGGLLCHKSTINYIGFRYIFVAFIIVGFFGRAFHVYLDAITFRCVSESTFPALKYMHTHSDRVKILDSILFELKRNTKPKQEVFMVGYICFGPLYFNDLYDWNRGVCTRGGDFLKRYKENLEKKSLPKIAFVDENSDEFKNYGQDVLCNYECIWRTYDTKEGEIQPFRYSIWKLKG